MKQPPCAKWAIWKGIEVEGGQSDLGKPTVFVRHLPPGVKSTDDFSFMRQRSKIDRLWICRELVETADWPLIRALAAPFVEVILEVRAEFYSSVPKDILQKHKVALKVSTVAPLKDGDFVCVGPAFNDESFVVGKGKRVTPDNYEKDIPIIKEHQS